MSAARIRLDPLEITGRARTHVVQIDDPRFAAQPAVVAAFMDLRRAAAGAGFDLLPLSAFRDFKAQLRIWNRKFLGQTPLFDRSGRPRDFSSLTPSQIMWAILRWTALPGASRHHWGTEIDVVDAAATLGGYAPQRLPQEVGPGGPYHGLHLWLDDNLARFGFFRPYADDRGGMHPEPWHLSHAETSGQALTALRPDLLQEVVERSAICGKDLVLAALPEIIERHVLNFSPPLELRTQPPNAP